MAEKMDATLKLSNGSVIPRIGLGSGTTGMDFKEAMVGSNFLPSISNFHEIVGF